LYYCSAEALDDHLTAVQRDHEHRSQIEERRIRDDAAREEAKRKEKALQEEKARQEMIRAEAKVCVLLLSREMHNLICSLEILSYA